MGGDRVDFFVSHAGSDRPWAEWVAWQLTEAGYSVELDVWDWGAGQNFVTAMSDALGRCDRVVALFSAVYFDRSRYTSEEWAASLLHVPGIEQHRLIPVRVEEVAIGQVPPLSYQGGLSGWAAWRAAGPVCRRDGRRGGAPRGFRSAGGRRTGRCHRGHGAGRPVLDRVPSGHSRWPAFSGAVRTLNPRPCRS
jgi:TIR domain